MFKNQGLSEIYIKVFDNTSTKKKEVGYENIIDMSFVKKKLMNLNR